MSWSEVTGFLITLVVVYSPLAAAPSYSPIIGHFDEPTRRKIAVFLFVVVAIFVVAAVWVGEWVVTLLGVSTYTLSIVGGIAILYAGIPMMRGIEHVPPEDPTDFGKHFTEPREDWRSLLFTPIAFPLSVGGTTIAISVSSAALASNGADLALLSLMGVVFGVIVGVSCYIGGSIPGYVGPTGRTIINRAAGVLLTAIGVTLVTTNVTRLVLQTLESAT